jgi:hypothetical protein
LRLLAFLLGEFFLGVSFFLGIDGKRNIAFLFLLSVERLFLVQVLSCGTDRRLGLFVVCPPNVAIFELCTGKNAPFSLHASCSPVHRRARSTKSIINVEIKRGCWFEYVAVAAPVCGCISRV